MESLTSRQEAIDAIDVLKRNYPSSCFEDLCKAVDIAIKALSAQPDLNEWCTDCKEYDQEKHCCPRWNRVIRNTIEEIKGAQPEQRWIPVTERLPEDERYVLVTTVSGDVTEAKYWQKEGFWVLKGLAIMSVTAWMPLPEVYRGK